MTDWTGIAAVASAVIAPTAALVGGLGGYRQAARADEARDRRAEQRDAAARRDAFAERLEEDRHHFQRDTLLELQDELLRLARSTALVMAEDRRSVEHSGQFFSLGGSLGTEGREIIASVQRLKSRVLDDQLRAQIERYVKLCGSSQMEIVTRFAGGVVPSDQKDAVVVEFIRRDRELGTAYDNLTNALGVHIRRELDRRYLATEPASPATASPPPPASVRRRLRRRGAASETA